MDDDPLAQLIRAAGRRAQIAPGRLQRVENAVRGEWQRVVRRRRLRRGAIGLCSGLIAAGVLFAVGSRYYHSFKQPVAIARVEFINGTVTELLPGSEQQAHPLKLGDEIFSGSIVDSDFHGRAALRLNDGQSLRLDHGTRIQFGKSTAAFHLETGAVYVDSKNTDGASSKSAVVIQTDFGELRDVGTQFEARITPSQPRPLCVRVREGQVDVKRESSTVSATAGKELNVPASGSPMEGAISPTDPAWDWAAATAPPFALEGSQLQSFLVWVAREQGWQVKFDDLRADSAAKTTKLHGVLDGFTPRTALDMVLPTCSLAYTLEDGTLHIRKRAVVSFVKVLSDKVEDVSSMDAWKQSFIKDKMTDEEKALAVWTSVVKFRHQANPPREFIFEGDVHDPIKTFNVYGYGQCCCASSNIEALGRYAGLNAQGRGLNGHSVPELFWNNSWHLLDASLINYFQKPDKSIASVDEIAASIKEWYGANVGFKGDGNKLVNFARGGGWKKGPALLANCQWYNDNGWLPAGTHGWASTMSEYDGSSTFGYEYGYSQGYQVNNQLREGERLTRNWSNKGMSVDQAEGEGFPVSDKVGENDLAYAPKFGDIAPGRIGNGTLEYNVPLASGAFRADALESDNLECKAENPTSSGAAVHVKDAGKPGVLTIRMNSSYVYLSGKVEFQAVVPKGGEIAVAFSDNNGLDWKELLKAEKSGAQSFDLKPLIHRKYDYRLRFTLKGSDTGMDSLNMTHDIQHSQRALPALGQGSNTITFSTGPDEGTVTVEGGFEKNDHKNLQITDFSKDIQGFNADDWFIGQTGKAHITFPLTTPGDMTRIRMGSFYRARGQGEGWDYQVSFDGGKTFKSIDKAEGPTVGNCKYITFSDIPAGARSALVRFDGHQFNTVGLFGLRIDADYKEPNGGFRPVKVTYNWSENGVEKTNVHITAKAAETYTIKCDAKPIMKAIVLELAQ